MKTLHVVSALATLCIASTALAQPDWSHYGGSPEQSKYFDYPQLTPANVDQMRIAWVYPSVDDNIYQFSPLIVGRTMYVMSKDYSLIALDAVTGKELWAREGFRGIARRGINYWQNPDASDRRLLVLMNNELHAFNAEDGSTITSFGNNGSIDLRQHLVRDPESIRRVQSNTPGAIFENLIVLGSSPGESYFSPPGHVRAYNVVTGELAWVFHTIPQPGEYGYETWPEQAYLYAGGANAWGDITIDTTSGIVFLPLGSPTYDYYGADRIGANLFGNSLVALDARTGERLWHYQTVHHDLWDYDLTAAPQLLSVMHEGKQINAVAQATKQGFLFVFNRHTGEPLWPIEERAVPPSEMPGEQAWPTQPFPSQLPVTARQKLDAEELTTLFITAEERAAWLLRIEAARSGLYQPISTVETIGLPGGVGGTNWGNTAADPVNGVLYVMNQDFPSFYRLEAEIMEPVTATQTAETVFTRTQVNDGEKAYQLYCQACHGGNRAGGANGPSLLALEGNIAMNELRNIVTLGQGRMPALQHMDESMLTNLLAYLSGGKAPTFAVGAEYPEGVDVPAVQYRTDYGLSHPHIMRPPWSTLHAIDLNTGTLKWKIPLGQDKLASELDVEGTGVPRGTQRNSMIITSTGLVFATAKDGHVYAFDASDGATLWQGELPMGTEGLPAMYVVDGKQYLVVNATTPLTWGPRSRESGINSEEPTGQGGYVVFALPD